MPWDDEAEAIWGSRERYEELAFNDPTYAFLVSQGEGLTVNADPSSELSALYVEWINSGNDKRSPEYGRVLMYLGMIDERDFEERYA